VGEARLSTDYRGGGGIRGRGGRYHSSSFSSSHITFDSGTSHCYISTSFVMMHSIPCIDLNTQWEISTGNKIITTGRICKSCSVVICEREFSTDIFVIDTSGYDVILGMTWLSKYHTIIDCQNKSTIL